MPNGCKFEVGKTYECTTGVIAKCLFAYDNGYYHCMIGERVKGSTGNVGYKEHFSGSSWKEHKEPRTITRWVNVYDRGDELSMGVPWETREKAVANSTDSRTYKDTIPITYTEPH